MLPPGIVVALVGFGIPAAFARLWWIWWQSTCGACGSERRACSCPSDGPIMRPRR